MQKNKGMQIETIFMILAILLLITLGIRGRLEIDLRFQDNKIESLEQEAIDNIEQINYLKEQLKPPKYFLPLDKIVISSPVGIRVNPMGGGKERLHEGLDLKGKIGNSVYSILSGKIVENWLPPGWYNGIHYDGHPIFGGYIVIDHGNQLHSKYGHLSKTIVHEDQYVHAGEKIGELGNSGPSTGPHLHFEIVPNPLTYLRERRKNKKSLSAIVDPTDKAR